MSEFAQSPSIENHDSRSLQKRILGLETLLELSRSLVSVQDGERLDGLVLLTVMGLLSVSRAILLTREPNGDEFHIYCRGVREDEILEGVNISPSGVFSRRLKATAGIATLREEGLPARESEVVTYLRDQKITHAAPIKAKGELKGIVLLGNRIDGQEITSFDAEMLQSILDLAGIVIDNVQLYENVRSVNVTLAESNQRLKEMDALKNEFFSNVGHELRTPLTCITGFAQCLSYPDLTKPQLQEFTSNIAHQSEKLSNLIDQILDLTELTDKSMSINATVGNLNDLIEEVAAQFELDLKAKEVVLDMELNPELPESLFDPERTRRVLRNLIDNAIKFSKPNGRVVVSSDLKDENIAFSVTDNGIGIPEKDRESIFESFRQVDGSETRSYGGAGIGLSLAKEIVEHQNGAICVASEEGEGSVFTVTLPVDPASSGNLDEDSVSR